MACDYIKNLLLASMIAFATGSCNQSPPNQQTTPETPKALQESGSADYSLLTKRKNEDDLVERLYSELVDKTPELKELENRVSFLYEAKTDSVTDFNNFNEKNNAYYSAAGRHLDEVTDSVLKDKIKLLINTSLAQYDTRVAKHKNLMARLDSKAVQLRDMHTMLKLVKTLALIEKYQKDNIPDTKSINRVINEFDKTIQHVDSLSRQ